MTTYGKHFLSPKTPQNEAARDDQKQNNAGGFSFVLDKWGRLDRFLVLGSEGGTYYVGERKLTIDNAKCVKECLAEDFERTISTIVRVSEEGRAPKNDPAIFALAIAAGSEDPRARSAALSALPKVCRIGTHLFSFAEDVQAFRRWGRGLRTAIARWYNEKTADAVAFQGAKYAQRNGWSHRDLLRLAHPSPVSPEHEAVFRWMAGGMEAFGPESRYGKVIEKSLLPAFVHGFEALRSAESEKEVIALIEKHGITHEMLDGKWKSSPKVWEALLARMGQTAMIRNLGKMTAIGLLSPMSDATKLVVEKIADGEWLRKGRVHPLTILLALSTYRQGRGDKGSLAWSPERSVASALDSAFYAAFKTIEPSKKNHYLALDVSGSMEGNMIAGSALSAREASAAMAMVTAATEPYFYAAGFSTTGGWSSNKANLVPLNFSKQQKLTDAVRAVSDLPFGGTDCALPMIDAMEKKLPIDTFVVYTDSETWAGHIHPHEALRDYRQKMGRPAKLIVVGLTATEITIADSRDAGMMDVVGFDSAAPSVMADFSRQ
jgi:60 kDa SS-A/Ro ribonucleoprotein